MLFMNTPKWSLIVAAGPSLRLEDVDQLRPVIGHSTAVNSVVFYVPWADVLYGCTRWWNKYHRSLDWYGGERHSFAGTAKGTKALDLKGWKRCGGNSGHQALQLCVNRGHRHILLIGFDHQHTNGHRHFHPDHPEGLGNAEGTEHWVEEMNRTAKDIEQHGIEVINLTRHTALTCFKRMTVESFLRHRIYGDQHAY